MRVGFAPAHQEFEAGAGYGLDIAAGQGHQFGAAQRGPEAQQQHGQVAGRRDALSGSIARGETTGASDVDLAVRPGVRSSGVFDHFGRLDALRDHLRVLLGCDVDLVEETAARARLRQVIEREGVRAF